MIRNIISKFTYDTNAIINILKNKATVDLIKCHFDVANYSNYLNSVSLDEASKIGFNKKDVVSKMSEYCGPFVIVEEVTDDDYVLAQKLEVACPLIHRGDSAIAAFSIKHNSILITYDKNLLKGCHIMGIPTLNPNHLIGCTE